MRIFVSFTIAHFCYFLENNIYALFLALIVINNKTVSDLKEVNNPSQQIDVLLIQPKSNEDSIMNLPLALLSVAGPLVKAGFYVKILDERLEDDLLLKIGNVLRDNNLLCIGVTCCTGTQIKSLLRIADFVKSRSNIPIVLGGQHATILPEQTLLDSRIDYVIRGEGEISFLNFVIALKNKVSPDNIKGLSYRKDGTVINNPPEELIDLNIFNLMPYHLLYGYKEKYKIGFIQTSRGCPYSCAYCVIPSLNHKKYRCMSVDSVIESLRSLLSFFNPEDVAFIDDNFFVDLDRIKELAIRLAHERLNGNLPKFDWWAECRADTVLKMSPNLIKLLIKTGLDAIYIGAESGSDKTLLRINKKITRETLIQANKYLSQFNLEVQYTWIIGFPFESKEDIAETFDLIKQLKNENPNVKIWRVNHYTHYPGIPLFDELVVEMPKTLEEWGNIDWYKQPANIKYDLQLR